jgi:hypothetical protein
MGMNKKHNPNKPKCSNCQSGWVYTKDDGTRICRTCGHREVVKISGERKGNEKRNEMSKKRR